MIFVGLVLSAGFLLQILERLASILEAGLVELLAHAHKLQPEMRLLSEMILPGRQDGITLQ